MDDLTGVGAWTRQLRYRPAPEAAEAAAELEGLGYTALWIPDTGGPVFEAIDNLMGATRTAVIATGILNLWLHTPGETAEYFSRFTAAHGDRFLMGVGVSHAPLIDNVYEAGRYRKPLAATTEFLDGLDAAEPPVPADSRVLAALGPKMLALAKARSRGVHPYLVTPEHTAIARAALGPDAAVLPEQTVVLCNDRDAARVIADAWLRRYLGLPNYANNLLRLGFTDEDLREASDRLFDALIVWGDEDTIKRRVDEHRAAGADHVCVQVLTEDNDAIPMPELRRLAAALC